MNAVKNVWREEPALTAAGLLGFTLAAFCAAMMAVQGVIVPPEGNLLSAFSFNAALGLFLITTAFLVPLAGFSRRKRQIFCWSYLVCAFYSYGAETVQHMRGFSPRYSQAGGTADAIIGGVFGLIAVLMIVYYVVLAWPFFRSRLLKDRPLLTIGIRYGMATTMLSFAGGLWMIALQSRYTGLEGNIIWFHGLGFHGLQMMPILALLVERNQSMSEKSRRHFLHAGGTAWLLLIILIGWQTTLGHSVLYPNAIMFISGGLLIGWVAVFIRAMIPVLKNRYLSLSHRKI